MYCDKDDCPRPHDALNNARHWFAGYGYYLTYHAECCPRSYDGTDCTEPHPAAP